VVAESVQRLDPAAVAQNRQRYEALQVKAS
jgi:hypothetical protein